MSTLDSFNPSSLYVPGQKAELSNFEAVKELLGADGQCSTIKNRISVLKVHDQRNLKKL